MSVISIRKRLIFIHNYKVAGTSIRQALMRYEPFWLRNRPAQLLKNRIIPPYATASELRRLLPSSIFDSYFKFGFVRNPWDWQISLFEYARQYRRHPQHALHKSFRDFGEYLTWRVNEDLHLQRSFFFEGDRCIVDRIYHFEDLDLSIEDLNHRLQLDIALGHQNRSRRANLLDYYDSDRWKLVADAFAEDIASFGYDPVPPPDLRR
jgi:hypothetical protein